MNLSNGAEIKAKLNAVLNAMATEQGSLDEFKRPMGAFIDLVAESTQAEYTETSKLAIAHAADDFRGLLYAMQLFEQVLNRPAPDDLLLRTMEARALIQVFFLDLRSIFDYLMMATLIMFSSNINQNGSKAWKSMLQQMVNKAHTPNFATARAIVLREPSDAISCFDPELVQIWIECGWFDEFNNWRNGITHEGVFVAVRNDEPELFLLETIKGNHLLEESSLPKQLFDEEGALSFRFFSGLLAGLMLNAVNSWAERLRLKANLPVGNRAYTGRGGTVLAENIKIVLSAFSKL
jgi:hypothetical protein